jgi:hypothetical protein
LTLQKVVDELSQQMSPDQFAGFHMVNDGPDDGNVLDQDIDFEDVDGRDKKLFGNEKERRS